MDLDIDIMHPSDPSSLDVHEVRRITNGRLALRGNISQAFPLACGSPADVRPEALAAAIYSCPGIRARTTSSPRTTC